MDRKIEKDRERERDRKIEKERERERKRERLSEILLFLVSKALQCRVK